jgi:phage shock protein PspC (stress-responsive transcriptional regulator)
MSTQYKSFTRSRDNRMVGGVCAGLGEFFGIDPTLVRLFFVFGALLGWAGPLVAGYLIMLIVVPEEPVSGAEIVPPPAE